MVSLLFLADDLKLHLGLAFHCKDYILYCNNGNQTISNEMIKKKTVQVFGYDEYFNNAVSIPGSVPA